MDILCHLMGDKCEVVAVLFLLFLDERWNWETADRVQKVRGGLGRGSLLALDG
jgi:hypothetical protein